MTSAKFGTGAKNGWLGRVRKDKKQQKQQTLSIKIVLPTSRTTTKLAESKAKKESITMRKQCYMIIRIGLAALAGVFWLSQLDGKEETPTTAKKPPSQETMDASPTEKPIDPFAGMRRQSTSELDPLFEEDNELMAKLDAFDEKEEAYQNSPRGNWMERYQDRSDEIEDWYDKKRIAKYKTNPDFRATADLDD